MGLAVQPISPGVSMQWPFREWRHFQSFGSDNDADSQSDQCNNPTNLLVKKTLHCLAWLRPINEWNTFSSEMPLRCLYGVRYAFCSSMPADAFDIPWLYHYC